MNEGEMLALARQRFPDPEFAFLPHVADGTGGLGQRTADAIVMNVWPSRGLELMGIEVKVSRADWLREMRNPAKAEGIAKYMDRWWLAVADRTIVKPGELPPSWGLMAVHANRLRVEVDAPSLQPKPLNRAFLAAILRSAARKLVEPDGVGALLAEEFMKGRREGERVAQRTGLNDVDREAYERLREAVKAFEAESGINVLAGMGHDAGRIGAAVRFLVEYDGWNKVLNAMETIRRADDTLHTAIADARLSEVPDFRGWRRAR